LVRVLGACVNDPSHTPIIAGVIASSAPAPNAGSSSERTIES